MDVRVYEVSEPSTYNRIVPESEIKLFAIPTSTKPVVPVGPATVKFSRAPTESNDNAVTVEFEVTENTFKFE